MLEPLRSKAILPTLRTNDVQAYFLNAGAREGPFRLFLTWPHRTSSRPAILRAMPFGGTLDGRPPSSSNGRAVNCPSNRCRFESGVAGAGRRRPANRRAFV